MLFSTLCFTAPFTWVHVTWFGDLDYTRCFHLWQCQFRVRYIISSPIRNFKSEYLSSSTVNQSNEFSYIWLSGPARSINLSISVEMDMRVFDPNSHVFFLLYCGFTICTRR